MGCNVSEVGRRKPEMALGKAQRPKGEGIAGNGMSLTLACYASPLCSLPIALCSSPFALCSSLPPPSDIFLTVRGFRLRRKRLKYARFPTRVVLTDVRRNSTLCPVNSPTFSQYLRKPSFFQDGTSIAVDEAFKVSNYRSINMSSMYSLCKAMKFP